MSSSVQSPPVKSTSAPSVSAELPRYKHYIDGALVAPVSNQYLETESPYSGKAWALIARGNQHDANAAVEAADRAFNSGEWPQLTPSERGRRLWKLGDLVIANAARLAEIEQRDNGKLATEVVAQVSTWATTSSTTPALPTKCKVR